MHGRSCKVTWAWIFLWSNICKLLIQFLSSLYKTIEVFCFSVNYLFGAYMLLRIYSFHVWPQIFWHNIVYVFLLSHFCYAWFMPTFSLLIWCCCCFSSWVILPEFSLLLVFPKNHSWHYFHLYFMSYILLIPDFGFLSFSF